MKPYAVRSMFFVMMLVSPASFAANGTPADPASAAHPELVVSTQWLADHLHDPKLVIVQIGHDVGVYRAGHIPGARFLSMDKFVDHHTPPEVELLPPEQLKKNLQEIGIGDDSRVVYYAPEWDPMATRLFFTMDYIGHGDQTALLDGGLDQWEREKRATEKQDSVGTPATLSVHLQPQVLAKIDMMKRLVADPDKDIVIIDSRPSRRYRAGHLAGAQSFYWQEALVSEKEPLLKSPQQLRHLFTEAGLTANKKAVSYCEVGLQASFTYFLARYLGLDAAMYDGSYNEWSAAKLPVVQGDSPR